MAGHPLVLADDLSGAAETAAALGARVRPELFLWPDVSHASAVGAGQPVVVDLDSRHLDAADAADLVRAALRALPRPAPLFKKIDSLLRGNVAAEVGALLDDGLVVFTPALPQQGRTVVDGILLDNGLPLAQTSLWALEPTPPPATVAAGLPALPVTLIPLQTVRSADLAAALAAAAGTVAVCDSVEQRDLDAIVAAGLRVDPDVRFVGSSALARALGPHLTPPPGPGAEGLLAAHPGGVLYVLGTGSAAAVAQADLLSEHVDVERIPVAPRDLALLGSTASTAADALGDTIASHLRDRSVAVQVASQSEPDVTGAAIVAGLARLVAATLAAAPDWPVRLMLTGGQTARAVLDALQCRKLAVVREIHPGAVLLTTDAGWLVATRPGSHGGPDSLCLIHHAMSTDPTEPPTTQENPRE